MALRFSSDLKTQLASNQLLLPLNPLVCRNGMSFLHHAAAVGHCTTARALLDANVDVNVKDKYTLTHCLSCNEPDRCIVPLSLSRVLHFARCASVASPAPLSSPQLNPFCLLFCRRFGRSPLHFFGSLVVTKLLISARADIDGRDR